MILKERTRCPICNSKEISIFKRGTFTPENIKPDNFKITDSRYGSLWNFFFCKKCSFVFSNPYIPEEYIVKFYSELDDKEYSSEADGRSKNFRLIIKRLKKIEKPGNNLLDIGAASGIFLNIAYKEGYNISGVEPSDFLVKEAKKLYGINLFKGTINDFKTSENFSVITLLDILEHLVNPDKFISKIKDLIKQNGILVIVTPDINSFTAKIFGKRWWHYRIAHINFFNLKSINILLKKYGFEIIKKKRYTWHFSSFYLITRIFPSLKNKKTLQKALKLIKFKLQLFDSWEIYARKN